MSRRRDRSPVKGGFGSKQSTSTVTSATPSPRRSYASPSDVVSPMVQLSSDTPLSVNQHPGCLCGRALLPARFVRDLYLDIDSYYEFSINATGAEDSSSDFSVYLRPDVDLSASHNPRSSICIGIDDQTLSLFPSPPQQLFLGDRVSPQPLEQVFVVDLTIDSYMAQFIAGSMIGMHIPGPCSFCLSPLGIPLPMQVCKTNPPSGGIFTEETKLSIFIEGSERPQLLTIPGYEVELERAVRAIESAVRRGRRMGVLIAGGIGSGKSRFLRCVAQRLSIPITRARTLVDSDALPGTPALLIDNLNASVPASERPTPKQLDLVDTLDEYPGVIVATAGSLHQLHERLHTRCRFRIDLSVPTESQRISITEELLGRSLSESEIRAVSAAHGFVPADLELAVLEAEASGESFANAISRVTPSSLAKDRVEIPQVLWSDVGGCADARRVLEEAIVLPLRHGEELRRRGITACSGALMYGPPGCSKTMLAKAIATETEVNFIAVQGPQLYSKWVGESEASVRGIFARARKAAPCVIFFDEFEALAGSRSDASGGSSTVGNRILSTLLNEMDGMEKTGAAVFVLAATNRPDLLDAALVRSGRFDKRIYLGLPSVSDISEILTIKLRDSELDESIVVEEIALKCEGYSAAEVSLVCNEALLASFKEGTVVVSHRHFEEAIGKVIPGTSPEMLKFFDDYQSCHGHRFF